MENKVYIGIDPGSRVLSPLTMVTAIMSFVLLQTMITMTLRCFLVM